MFSGVNMRSKLNSVMACSLSHACTPRHATVGVRPTDRSAFTRSRRALALPEILVFVDLEVETLRIDRLLHRRGIAVSRHGRRSEEIVQPRYDRFGKRELQRAEVLFEVIGARRTRYGDHVLALGQHPRQRKLGDAA